VKYIEKDISSLTRLDTRFVVQYYSAWIETRIAFIRMEFCSQSLREVLNHKAIAFDRRRDQTMTEIEFFMSCEVIKEIVECVKYLHEFKPQIIHKRLKPENFLISADNHSNDKRFFKLSDFGLREVFGNNVELCVRENDKYKYTAPEVTIGGQHSTHADVYSLGVIAMEVFDIGLHQ